MASNERRAFSKYVPRAAGRVVATSTVHFELDWPPGAPTPISGILRWRGTLALDGKTQDTVQVAALTF